MINNGDKDLIRKLLLARIGLEREGLKVVNLQKLKVRHPNWYSHSLPPWHKQFQKAIEKRIQARQDLQGKDWLLFCLSFAEHVAYSDKNIKRHINQLRKYIKYGNRKRESLLHIKEKAKAFFWLLDSGIKPEWISIEGVWKRHRSDILVSIPLKGFIQALFSNYETPWLEDLSLRLAVEVGDWHKEPEYLQEGIPIVWIPYRKTPIEEILSFVKKLQTKYSFEVLSFVHYVHVLDETLSGIFFLPKPIKEVE